MYTLLFHRIRYPIPELESLRNVSDHHRFDDALTLSSSTASTDDDKNQQFMKLDGVFGTRLDILMQVNSTLLNSGVCVHNALYYYLLLLQFCILLLLFKTVLYYEVISYPMDDL